MHHANRQALDMLSIISNNYGVYVSGLVAIATFVCGYLLQGRTRRTASLLAWKNYRDDIIRYATDVIDTISGVEGLCEANPKILGQEFWNKRSDLLSRLSALRDRGRLLIPNLSPDEHGPHKATAYRGYRQRALDCVNSAFWLANSINFQDVGYNKTPLIVVSPMCKNPIQIRKIWVGLKMLPDQSKIGPEGPSFYTKVPGWSSKRGVVEAKRQFVSEIQTLIDPRRWIDEIGALLPARNRKTHPAG